MERNLQTFKHRRFHGALQKLLHRHAILEGNLRQPNSSQRAASSAIQRLIQQLLASSNFANNQTWQISPSHPRLRLGKIRRQIHRPSSIWSSQNLRRLKQHNPFDFRLESRFRSIRKFERFRSVEEKEHSIDFARTRTGPFGPKNDLRWDEIRRLGRALKLPLVNQVDANFREDLRRV